MDGFRGWRQWLLIGIPCVATRMVEFTVEDKNMREIGRELRGSQIFYANNGSIYCMPDDAKYFLKFIPGENQNVEVQIMEELEISRAFWK